jgi:hypothetical protein
MLRIRRHIDAPGSPIACAARAVDSDLCNCAGSPGTARPAGTSAIDQPADGNDARE